MCMWLLYRDFGEDDFDAFLDAIEEASSGDIEAFLIGLSHDEVDEEGMWFFYEQHFPDALEFWKRILKKEGLGVWILIDIFDQGTDLQYAAAVIGYGVGSEYFVKI
jgi:hypothetical protein